ncbi:MAG: acetate--CoA ligase family protein [Vicinamibacterales bacterium]
MTPEARPTAADSVRAILEPRSIAVIGASPTHGKIGAEILVNLLQAPFPGPVYAVHPTAKTVHGAPAFPRVTDLPEAVDLAVVCVPAAAVPGVVDDCAARGVRGLVVISAGFSETGAHGREVEDALVASVRRAGLRMVGPNCMGVLNMNPAVRLNATFSPIVPPAGTVAMSTQSGALGIAILDYAKVLGIGISSFASVGNAADVSTNDLLEYWADDPRTDVILLYVESFGNPHNFSRIARRTGRRKPIVAVKAGRSPEGARAASSHTGALASSDVVVGALLEQAGVIRVTTIEEMFDTAHVLATQTVPRGRRVGILTNAGGPAILAADACVAEGLRVPKLAAATTAALRDLLPPAASVGNPVDMIASATAEQYERALRLMLDDPNIDSVIVIFIPPLVTRPDAVAAAVRRAVKGHEDRAVLAVFMSSHTAGDALAPIPVFRFPEAAAAALANATRYGEWRAAPDGTWPDLSDIDDAAIRRTLDTAIGRGDDWLSPDDVRALLEACHIPQVDGVVAASADEAERMADGLGYPVVLKALGPTLVHKTESKAVLLDLPDAAAVRRAWAHLRSSLGDRMTGGLVQRMIGGGIEMLVGAVRDPVFGPVVMCASGGTLTELLADRSVRLPPLTREDAAEMVGDLHGAVLLRGHRGDEPRDEAAFHDVILRVAHLITSQAAIQELDINPLAVLPRGALALDARIRIAGPAARPPAARPRRSVDDDNSALRGPER